MEMTISQTVVAILCHLCDFYIVIYFKYFLQVVLFVTEIYLKNKYYSIIIN